MMRKSLVSDLHDTRPRVRFRFFLSFRFFRSPLSFRLDSGSLFPFDSLDPPFIQEHNRDSFRHPSLRLSELLTRSCRMPLVKYSYCFDRTRKKEKEREKNLVLFER